MEPSGPERAAYEIVKRVLGVSVEHRDTQAADRQGSVDAHLHYPDGRLAALEVSRLADPSDMQMDSILSRTDWTWPNPGRWWWTVSVGSVSNLPRLREIYSFVISLCESLNVNNPDRLGWPILDARPWLNWLRETGSTMIGHPDVPARRDDGTVRGVMVTSSGIGGAVDETLSGLSGALTDVLGREPIAQRVRKLQATDLAERHLFLAVDLTGLPFAISDALIVSRLLPPDRPRLPEGLTHLWLTPRFGRRLLVLAPTGWSEHDPYD